MTDPWGIDDGYSDIAGAWHETPEPTRRALRVAMGGHPDLGDPPPRSRPVWVVRHGSEPAIERPAELVLEDGTHVGATAALPPDLPLGYHDLHPSDGGPTTRLIVAPDRCQPPGDGRRWGWSVQLYATRSRESAGIGDLVDLARLARWSAGLGAGFVVVNPLHAALPLPAQEPSPYFPSSRRFVNPLYLRVDGTPGGAALNESPRIDRDAVYAAKLGALEAAFEAFPGDPRFDRFVQEQGTSLWLYGVFCALAEHHGTAWPAWPAEHRRPESPGVRRFATAMDRRVRFHMWIQWLLDEQLAGAAAALPLVVDLAIGVDPGGADSWVWQDVLARDARVGAPPDAFNPDGQDWGLPPFVPWKLRAAGYEPLAETIRAALRRAGGVRIDHVMGLFRLYWIPNGAEPSQGAYVRYASSELLDVVALESVRAGAFVVGEDLGTVEDAVRDELRERGALSYRLFWFEQVPPEQYPAQSLAAVTTHDLPTVAGVWTGADVGEQARAGVTVNDDSAAALRARLEELVAPDATAADAVRAAYRRLSAAPSVARAATLEDALAVEVRPNMPGTTTQRENWSLALPLPLEELECDTGVLALAEILREGTQERLKSRED